MKKYLIKIILAILIGTLGFFLIKPTIIKYQSYKKFYMIGTLYGTKYSTESEMIIVELESSSKNRVEKFIFLVIPEGENKKMLTYEFNEFLKLDSDYQEHLIKDFISGYRLVKKNK